MGREGEKVRREVGGMGKGQGGEREGGRGFGGTEEEGSTWEGVGKGTGLRGIFGNRYGRVRKMGRAAFLGRGSGMAKGREGFGEKGRGVRKGLGAQKGWEGLWVWRGEDLGIRRMGLGACRAGMGQGGM